MREILFRGQTEAQKKWIFGDLLHGMRTDLVWIDNHEDGAISDLRVIPETVGQYIGKTDKNGQKIFTDDIEVIGNIHDNPELLEVQPCNA